MKIWKYRNVEIWKYKNVEIWKYGNTNNNNVANVTEGSSQLEIFKLCIYF